MHVELARILVVTDLYVHAKIFYECFQELGLGIKVGEASFEVYKDVAGKFRFRLKAPNDQIVAVSEGYETKAGCMNGVKAVRKYSGAAINDLTVGETTLILNEPTRIVKEGSIITFSGKLLCCAKEETEEPVAGAKVDIYERDRSFMNDDYLASGNTRSDGTFNIGWKAKKMDWWDNRLDVYATFKGTASHKPSRSNQYRIIIVA